MESTANGIFFPYSVLICAKSRLRGFRSTEIHAVARNQRNKRAPSGSAKQHIQYKPSGSAQSAQSKW